MTKPSLCEEAWKVKEQTEFDKRVEPDFPWPRKPDRARGGKDKKNYNCYCDEFVVDKNALNNIKNSVVGLDELMISHDIDLVDDREAKWIETKSNETVKSIQDIDQSSFKYFNHDNTESNWVRPDGT